MYPQSGVAKNPQHRLSLLLGKEMAMPGSVTRSSSEVARSECLPALAFLFDAYFRNKGLFSEILLLTSGPKEDNSDMVLVIDKREGQNLTPRPHVKTLGMVVCTCILSVGELETDGSCALLSASLACLVSTSPSERP